MHVSNDESAENVVAEHYADLQSLPLIEQARIASGAIPATPGALLIALYQSAEIALYNLSDLLERATVDIEEDNTAGCAEKLNWSRGFHRVLIRLSLAAEKVALEQRITKSNDLIFSNIEKTPAFTEFFAAQNRFDSALRKTLTDDDVTKQHLSTNSFEDAAFAVLHRTRTNNHDARCWTKTFLELQEKNSESNASLSSSTLRLAVHEHRLQSDTYFTQFRALHQIPELLALEVNDRLESAVRHTRKQKLHQAVDLMCGATKLLDPIEACLPPIVDNLSPKEYHRFREHLGLTSGSHSVSLRFHLFGDLYAQLHAALAELHPQNEDHSHLTEQLWRELIALRAFIFAWRDMHIHLARNNLGGGGTKSLIGSADAINAVTKMANHARHQDPLGHTDADVEGSTDTHLLAKYFDDEDSLDAHIIRITGEMTQEHFPEIQNRDGIFAQRCPFKRPPRRVVDNIE